MSDTVQRYRMTFKCNCGKVFKKVTTNIDLQAMPCPECKTKDKKTKLFKIGDGPISQGEIKVHNFEKQRVFPNTIYKCNDCYSLTKIFEDIGEKSIDECPACGSKNIQFRGKIAKDICGDNAIKNKCVDKTADIVMTDYGMTDLKDSVRQGEAMAPKLAPTLQTGADNFFGGARAAAMPRNAAAIAKRALAGSFRDRSYLDPVAALHTSEKKAGGRRGVVQ